MNKDDLSPPGRRELEEAGTTLLQEFSPDHFRFLKNSGALGQNPSSLRDKISHELLFRLKSGRDDLGTLLGEALLPLASEETWPLVKRTALALSQRGKSAPGGKASEWDVDRALRRLYFPQRPWASHPFLILWEFLLGAVESEVLRLESEAFVPDWDEAAGVQRARAVRGYHRFNRLVERALGCKEYERWELVVQNLKRSSASTLGAVSRFIREEDASCKLINAFLEKARDPKCKEEICELILEKIQPPQGIVTNTSPALLRPCLTLLLDDRVEIESGIPYMSSIVLSILQDPRSAETLLAALRHFPFYYTKIRENIVYTLGTLRDERAVAAIIPILEGPDELEGHPLLEQKEEAIWALGKIGRTSLGALPSLVKYADHPSPRLKTCLAWTLGEVGKAQKDHSGGVNADIAIALLKLLKAKNKQVFEESASALKKIDMPEFVRSLYLYNAGAISLLGLKQAQRGLYELSETIHYLLQTKKMTVMAVNGDSGTGKTYFCQTIAKGFGTLKPEEILYLMRDRKKDQKVFNRMLGLEWLKKRIEPVYYHDYPLREDEDRPDEFFREFLKQNSDKKLIILDGCRDRYYFQKIVDLFYIKGELDVEVNFRATFSTRRLNLETREVAIESVKTHLAFLEEPALEDTQFYQEGIVTLYDFDNSISSRLDGQEIKELFDQRKIDSWGDLIRIGDFHKDTRPLPVRCQELEFETGPVASRTRSLPRPNKSSFVPEERKFKPSLNEDLNGEPYLLQTVEMNDLKPRRIRFYTQDQIAGLGEAGNVFVLTFLDRRIFSAALGKAREISLLGRDIYLSGENGELWNISFERNEWSLLGKTNSPVTKLASFPRQRIVSGHADGSLRVWDLEEKRLTHIQAHSRAVLALIVDHAGRVYSGSADGTLKQWSLETKTVRIVKQPNCRFTLLKLYPQDRVLALAEKDTAEIGIFDFERSAERSICADFRGKISSINVYYDGRIIAGLRAAEGEPEPRNNNLLIISGGRESEEYRILGGHGRETWDCLTMGPKIISCGLDDRDRHSLKVWGTEFYVRMELSKLSLYP